MNADPKTAIGGDKWARAGSPSKLPDFDVLKSVWGEITPTGVSKDKYSETNGPIECPASTSGVWNVDPESPLPTIGQTAAPEEAYGTPVDREVAPEKHEDEAKRKNAGSKCSIAVGIAILAALFALGMAL